MKRKLGPEYGVEGEFFVDGSGFKGQDADASVINHNQPPSTQPSLWCQWRPSEDKLGIEWDGGEKFYEYTKWLDYIVKNFIKPKGYSLNGEVEWIGEDPNDRGLLIVKDNLVSTKIGRTIYE